MSINGRITVDVQFVDSTTSAGVQSVKTLTLQSATEYTTGRVAIVTGTVSTTATQIDATGLSYRDSSGNIVDFAPINGVDRVAFAGSSGGTAPVECIGDTCGMKLFSRADQCAASECTNSEDIFLVRLDATSGTASYTLVLWGE